MSWGRSEIPRHTARPTAACLLVLKPGRASALTAELDAVTGDLEREGVAACCDSYTELLDCIEAKVGEVRSTHASITSTSS